jgi:hypothetical protein
VALFIALSGFEMAEARNRSDQLHNASQQYLKKVKKNKPGKYKAPKHKKPKKAKWGAKTRNI